MSREDPQMKIRLPQMLKFQIEVRAERNKRSINAEIVSLLERAVSNEPIALTSEEFFKGIESIKNDLKEWMEEREAK